MAAKSLTSFLLACLLMAVVSSANDRRWASATEELISSGPTTISTSKEKRAHLAQEIAERHGRKTKVESSESGFRIVVD